MLPSTPRNIEKRMEILAASRILLRQKNLEDIRMEDIAQIAGRTRKTLYAHFRSRDDVLVQLSARGLDQLWRRQMIAMRTASTGLEQIRAWGEACASFARYKPRYLRLQVYLDARGIDREKISPNAYKKFDTQNRRVATALRDAFHLGLQDGSLRPDLDVETNLAAYTVGLRSILSTNPKQLYRQFLDTFLRGLAR